MAIVENAHPWNNKIRALCDTGSQSNLITSKAVKRLGLQQISTNQPFTGTLETSVAPATKKVTVQIKLDRSKSISCTFYVVQQVICHLPMVTPSGGTRREFKPLKLADPEYLVPAEVDALFGAQIWLQIVLPQIIKTKDEQAIAQHTRLGYVILQSPQQTAQAVPRIYTTRVGPVTSDIDDLSRVLQQFWTIDTLSYEHRLTPEEQECEELFTTTHTHGINMGDMLLKCHSTTRSAS